MGLDFEDLPSSVKRDLGGASTARARSLISSLRSRRLSLARKVEIPPRMLERVREGRVRRLIRRPVY